MRSGRLPLYVDGTFLDAIDDDVYHNVRHTNSHMALAATLSATASRWTSARIVFSQHSYIYNALIHILRESGSFEHLKSLTLGCTSQFYRGDHPSDGMLPEAPRLQDVELYAIDPNQISLPWPQLHSLTFFLVSSTPYFKTVSCTFTSLMSKFTIIAGHWGFGLRVKLLTLPL